MKKSTLIVTFFFFFLYGQAQYRVLEKGEKSKILEEIERSNSEFPYNIVYNSFDFEFTGLFPTNENLDKLKLILQNEEGVYSITKSLINNNYFVIVTNPTISMEYLRDLMDPFGIDIKFFQVNPAVFVKEK